MHPFNKPELVCRLLSDGESYHYNLIDWSKADSQDEYVKSEPEECQVRASLELRLPFSKPPTQEQVQKAVDEWLKEHIRWT